MKSRAAGLCHLERSEKHVVIRQSVFIILIVLLLLVASNCARSAQRLQDKTSPKVVRQELKQILSQPEYNRIYKENKPPKWWTDFSHKASRVIMSIFLWLSRSLGLQGEKAGRVTSFVFACLVIVAFFALLALIIRKISVRLRMESEDGEGIGTLHYELPSARPLISEAARLADISDWRGAFRCVYLASISHLDEIGAPRFEKSRTNWEYLHELDKTGHTSLRDQLRPLTSDFDRKFYGRERCDKEDYTRALDVYKSIIKGETA